MSVRDIICNAAAETKGIRCITFQSKSVVDQILSGETFYARRGLARECNGDEQDIVNCNGHFPIWVFIHPLLHLKKTNAQEWLNFLELCRCEMSVSQDYNNDLTQFYMIELMLKSIPPKGIEHNGSSLARVIPSISINDCIAVYELSHTYEESAIDYDWFYISMAPVYKKADCLFQQAHSFTCEEYKNDNTPRLKLYSYGTVQDYYKGDNNEAVL